MKKTMRAISFVLATLLALSALAACGGREKMPEKQVVDHVYKYNQTKLVTVEEPDWSNEEEFQGYTYLSNNSLGKNGYCYVLQSVNKDYETTSTVAHIGTYGSEEVKEIPIDLPNDEQHHSYMDNMLVLDDGLAVFIQTSTLIDSENYIYDQNYYLYFYDFSGNGTGMVDLKKAFDITGEDSYFYVNTSLTDGKDLYFICDTNKEEYSNKLICFGTDGTIKNTYALMPEGEEGYINNIYFIGDSELLYVYENYNSNSYTTTCKRYNLETGAQSEVDTGDLGYRFNYNSFGGDGAAYYSDNYGIYKVDLDTGVQTELMNYINSDYIYNYGNFYALDGDRFASLTREYKDNKTTLYMNTFEKVPDSELTPKYLITVASAGYAYNFQEQIVKFNLASEEYRIKYVDYSQYNTDEDYTAGKTKLNDDILAGNVPDVIISDSEFSVSRYVNKGLFADLYTYLEKDPEFSKDDFLTNILKACEIGGKLYEIPTGFYVMGLMGGKDKISEFANLTIPEFAAKVAALPEGVSFFREGEVSRANMLQMLFYLNYTNFIDTATGKCSFNNDDFKAILEYVNTLPEKTRWEDENFNYEDFDWDAYNNAFKEGKAIAEMTSLDSFYAFENQSYNFGGMELEFVGMPSPDRDGLVFTCSNLKFLISAKSPMADEAWNFVKLFFTEEYQTEDNWAFSVTKAGLEKQKQAALDAIKEREAAKQDTDSETDVMPRDSEAVVVTASGTIISEPSYNNDRRDMTVEDVERIAEIATSVHKQLIYNENVFNIVSEEASAYFAGKKSADEVASLIENRVQIYIGESR